MNLSQLGSVSNLTFVRISLVSGPFFFKAKFPSKLLLFSIVICLLQKCYKTVDELTEKHAFS